MTNVVDPQDTRPAIFISHRHVDHEIARVLQEGLVELLGESVRIFNTSDSRADGFKTGGRLSEEIRAALGVTSLVILLYTTDDADWRWCFFECGVANDPADEVPTTTVVLEFDTENGTAVFSGDLHLALSGNPGPSATADFRRFVVEVGRGEHPALAGAEPQKDFTKEELEVVADRLYGMLIEVAPAAQHELAQEFLDVLTEVPVAHRRETFKPLFTDAANALRWGLGEESGVRKLFTEYWNDRLRDELDQLSDRRLVFPPGRVYLDWARLLDICEEIVVSDGNRRRVEALERPILSLVSHEAARLGGESSFIEFWHDARRAGTDASFYERPVRDLARRLHAHFDGQIRVAERTFVLDRQRFSEQAAEQLADVATWMAEAHIGMSVTFEDQRREDDLDAFDDFGLVGWTAVSRFKVDERDRRRNGGDQPLDRLSYRSLTEDFSPEVVTAGEAAWASIRHLYRWSGPGECDPAELYSALTADH